jgi:hypothetical protein
MVVVWLKAGIEMNANGEKSSRPADWQIKSPAAPKFARAV